jgi:DNA polymerase-3 subunit epsilon
MRPALKYWTFLFTIIAIIFAVLLGSFAGSWFSLNPDEQTMVRGLFNKLIPFPVLGALALVMILGSLVSLLFRYYVIPVLLLAEKARLITTVNPAYRIVPTGAREMVYLTEVINDSAEAYQKLQTEVNEQIRVAKNELHEERNRLAALMAELPSGVLVCNIAGQILLYNPQAQRLLQSDGEASTNGPQGAWVGLGRSVFGVLARDSIVNALEWLQQAVNKGQRMPISAFMTTLRDGTCLRVSMTPVFKHQQDRNEMTGFVLSLEDMTQQIESNSRLDLLIQSLTDNMQKALDQIRQSILTILQTPNLDPEQLGMHRKHIDSASLELQQQLIQAREEYALHQQDLGKMEDVLAEDLHQVLQKSLREHYSIDVSGQTDSGLHLQIDSYSFIQSISHLAGVLRIREDITSLVVNINKAALNQAAINLDWTPSQMPEHLIADWEKAPLITDRKGQVMSLQDLVVQQGGSIHLKCGKGQACHGAEILLPASHEEMHLHISDQPEARPVNYEFDLFHQEIGAKTGKQPLRECTYVVFDTETTGLFPSEGDEIIQIGAIRIVRGRLLHNEIIDQLVDPLRSVPASSVEIHGIDPELLKGQPTIEKVLPGFHKFAEGAILVAHNAAFDMKFLQLKQARAGVRFDHPVLDTLLLSSIVHPTWGTHSLDEIAEKMNVTIVGRHTALGDAIVTAEILMKLIPLLQAKGINTLEEARRVSSTSQYAKIAF